MDYQKELDAYILEHSKSVEKSSSFAEYLYTLLDKYGYSKSSDVYNKAFMSRQLWSSIISSKTNPSLNTCLKIVFALHLNNHECKYLLKKAGYTLSSSSKYALIIRFCIINKIYDIFEVNNLLMQNGYEDSLIL